MRRFFMRLVVFLLLLVFVLEISVRLFLPQRLRPFHDIYAPHEGLGFVVAPNLDVRVNEGEGEGEVRLITNDRSFRVSEGWESAPEPDLRVLAIGDSFLTALQVDYSQTMTHLLEESLTESMGQMVRVDNMNRPGFDVNHYLIAARQLLYETDYNLLWIFIYPPNDMISSIQEHYPASVPQRQLKAIRLPNRLSSNEIADALFLPIVYRLEITSQLFIMLQSRLSMQLTRMGLRIPRFEIDFPDQVRVDYADDPSWELTGEVVGKLQLLADEVGVPMIVSITPAYYQIYPDSLETTLDIYGEDWDFVDMEQPGRLLEESFQMHGVRTVINLYSSFRSIAEQSPTRLYGVVDPHFSPAGHLAIANILQPIFLECLQRGSCESR